MNKNIRVLFIVEQLTLHKKVCIKELSQKYDLKVRNLQKDFELLKEYFSDRLLKIGDCYSLLKQEQFYDLFKENHKTSKQFLKFLSMVDSELYSQFKQENIELIKALKLDSSLIYQIENSPYEHLKSESLEILEQLESAITNRTYITIVHQKPNEKLWIYKESQVLKILYLEDNWYITVNTTANYHKSNPNSCFRLMRISFIKKISPTRTEPKNFYSNNSHKIKAENAMHHLQSPFSKIHNKPYIVLVKISAYASVYFSAKQYLKSQRMVKKYKNRETLFEFTITDDMEIMPLIQQWIPHLKVIEPIRIKEQIEEKMRAFMKGE